MRATLRSSLAPLAMLAAATHAPAQSPAQTSATAELNLGRMTAGYSYYNRPGAEMARHDAEVSACLLDVANARSAQDRMRGDLGGILGGLIANAQADSANRGVLSASLENCMVVRGWRVVHLDDREGEPLSRLPAPELAKTLAPWVGAATPHGTIVRAWHNDAALGAVNHFSLHAQHTKNGQLSLLASATPATTPAKPDPDAKDKASAKPVVPTIDSKWPKKALTPETLASAPEDGAIFLVNIAGVSLRQGNGFIFIRVGPDPNTAASSVDHGPDAIVSLIGTLASGGEEGKMLAFAVPPGKWRIYGMQNGLMTLSFCLGSPSFEMKAGDVVYGGRLDLKQDLLKPDLSLDRPRAWMAGAKAAERLKPAVWTNGSRGACGGNSIYALEFDGAPFESGYDLGSKAANAGG